MNDTVSDKIKLPDVILWVTSIMVEDERKFVVTRGYFGRPANLDDPRGHFVFSDLKSLADEFTKDQEEMEPNRQYVIWLVDGSYFNNSEVAIIPLSNEEAATLRSVVPERVQIEKVWPRSE